MKTNKKQQKAVETLAISTDELTNKPRRLFQALRDFAEAFVEGEKTLRTSIASIDEMESWYYNQLRLSDLTGNVIDKASETRKELRKTKEEIEERHLDYRDGVHDATEKLTQKIATTIIEHYLPTF